MVGLSMSPTMAKRLYDSGAFVVMLDVPKGTEFGIDFPSWNVGEKWVSKLVKYLKYECLFL